MSTWMDSPTFSSPSSSIQVNATTVAMGINTMVNYTGRSGNTPPPSYEAGAKFNPSMAIIIVVLLGTFFFMAFLSIYVKKCVTTEGDMEHHHIPMSWAVDHSTGMRRWHPQHQHPALLLHQQQGLDKASIQALPLVCFTKSKDCVVCLSEFQQNECLRLLPRCGHTFHVECIDMWLVSHTTCPICRFNLTLPVETPLPAPASGVHHLPLQQNIHQQSESLPPASASPAAPVSGAESNRASLSPAPARNNSQEQQVQQQQGDISISIAELEQVALHEQECIEHQTQQQQQQQQQQHNNGANDGQRVQGLLHKVWKVFKSWKTGFGPRIFS